uniref:RING-type domain-containing protein n=1 Tax=Seriola dumerili TaxID=41447 RepID=A0A3B4UTG3_SERDU
MASAAASPSQTCPMEKHLTCSICMDTFQDPVTTDCGHSFCKKCLSLNFNYTDRVCPLCKKPQNRLPDVNIVLRDIEAGSGERGGRPQKGAGNRDHSFQGDHL